MADAHPATSPISVLPALMQWYSSDLCVHYHLSDIEQSFMREQI